MPGSTVTIAAQMDVTQPGGVNYNSDNFLIYFNPEIVAVSGVYPAGGVSTSDPNSLWNSLGGAGRVATSYNVVNISSTESVLIISQYWNGATPPTIAQGTTGDLAQITITVASSALPGSRTPLIVGANYGQTQTNFDGSASAVNPAPSNLGGLVIDGSITITPSTLTIPPPPPTTIPVPPHPATTIPVPPPPPTTVHSSNPTNAATLLLEQLLLLEEAIEAQLVQLHIQGPANNPLFTELNSIETETSRAEELM
jgi:hypothetical protein